MVFGKGHIGDYGEGEEEGQVPKRAPKKKLPYDPWGGAPGISKKTLNKQQWIQLRKGIKFIQLFATTFPGGLKEVITLTKKSAKDQVGLSVLNLFSPVINILDQAAAEITKSLGINDSIVTIQNAISSVLIKFAGFVGVLLKMFTGLEDEKNQRNLINLIGWIIFFTTGAWASPKVPGGSWGIVLPPW